MGYKQLILFVEGKSDKLLLEDKITPLLERKYDHIGTWEYARVPKTKIADYLDKVKKSGSDFLFVADLNGNPCVGRRKEKLTEIYPFLKGESIQIVVTVIEGWYLAGLDNDGCKELRIECLKTTDKVSEGQFDDIRKTTKMKDIDFRTEILKLFNTETAVTKNKSFAYFYDKYLKENNNN